MQPNDLDHLAVPGDPQLHPDGVRTAYVLTEVDVDGDRYVRTIQLHHGTGTRPFTHGPSDSSPRWSPDGRWLAFLRTGPEDGQRPQLHVMPADGGEARCRTDLPLGVSDLAWSPDSRRLVVVAGVWDPELADLDDDERKRRPRRITRLPYRTDSGGYVHDRTQRLHLVDVDGERTVVALDTGSRDAGSPNWHPDGTAIAYLSDPDDWPQTEPHSQVFALTLPDDSVGGGGATGDDAVVTVSVDRAPLTPPGLWVGVHHDPAGRVFVTGLRDPFEWPGTPAIWLLGDGPADERPLLPLTTHLDRDVTPGAPGCATTGPRFVADGFLTVVEGRGSTGIVHVHLDDHDPASAAPPRTTEVISGPRSVTGYGVSADAGVVVFTATDPATPGELLRRDGSGEQRLTELAQGFGEQVDVRPTQRFTTERDGVELDIWAVLPPGFDEAAPGSVPVLFNIHGGPTSQYGEYFFDEFQVQAAAGYLVVGTNPRGSSGRGTEWARAVVGAWASEDSVDTLDLEVVVDATCARFAQADPDRVGVMGGSYGGYAAARLLARTDRYGSAIVERGLLQWESFSGTSDIGPYFDRMFLGASLLEGAEVHQAASPVRTAHRITTPTLVLHSEADWRCPPEQGEQLFAALIRSGVPTEMVRFPDEGHELSRAGKPRHRIERHEIVLDWHARHLLGRDGSSG